MKVTVIGAGSASFGLNTVSSLLSSEKLRGCHISLVDRNPETLDLMVRLARRLNQDWQSEMNITAHVDHLDALPGTNFVISAIEVPPREKLWRQDFEITLKYGLRQPYAENGGPGGFAHAARNVLPVLRITQDMEKICPDAWFINFSNPMTRICYAVAQYSKIKVVGLCHQVHAAYGMIGYLMADELGIKLPNDGNFVFSTHADPKFWHNLRVIADQAHHLIDVKAAGLNHFTWVLDVRHKLTGEDLYPALRSAWARADEKVEPLTHRVFDAFGLMPVPGDEHLDEYLPWCSDPQTRPWEKYELDLYDWDRAERGRDEGHQAIRKMGNGEMTVDDLRDTNSEGAREVIEAAACGQNDYHIALNLPNTGQIANLPRGIVVETPGVLTPQGPIPVHVGALPEGVAELLRREAMVGKLCVDSAVNGDRHKALQSLLLDPVITDMDLAKQILDDYLTTYREYLPQYW